ncbi:MAG: hypothetical protein P4L86_05370 [Mycobacterium sp.]|nr:hypothetical protein [Mycobacterium sp.]
MDRHHGPGTESPSAEYRFDVRCSTRAEAHIRSLVFDAISRPHLTVRSIEAPEVTAVRWSADSMSPTD